MHPFLFQSHRKISYPARFISILGIISSSLVCVIPIIPVFDLLPVHFALCIFESKLLMFSYSKCKSIIVVFSSEIRRVGSVFTMTRYVKRVQIRSFFWSVFCRIRTRKNSVFGHFSRSDILRELSGITKTQGSSFISNCLYVKMSNF